MFEKEDADVSPSNVNAKFSFSTNEEALLTTVAISDNSVALYDHGAMRYLDFNNTRTTPEYFNGVLYIPAFALARSLDLYLEDYSDIEYVFLRSMDDKIEIFYEKGEAYFTTAGVKKKIDFPVVYDNGLTWLPVKQTAELFEKTVLHKNAITVIDLKKNAENIINNSGVFSELEQKLLEYSVLDNSQAKVYHVSKDKKASDHNPGTESYPFESISKAAEVAEPGDTVIIHEGIYSETIVPKNSGMPSKPIRYMAKEGDEVIVSNVTELSGFAKYNDKIWCVKVPKKVGKYRLQVFHEGKALVQGRHPNKRNQDNAVDYYASTNRDLFGVQGDITIKINQGNANNSATLSGTLYATSDKGLLNQVEKDYWKGATWTGLKGSGWSLSTALVTRSEYGKVYLDDGGYKQASITYFNANYPCDWGFLSNHINCVDLPGEWYYDGKTLYIIPPEGVSGEDLTVSVKQGFTSFDLTDKSFIELHNISTRAASITMAGDSNNNVLNGGTHEYVSFTTFSGLGAYGVGYDAYAEAEEDSMEKGSAGIFVNGENNAILNTTITNTATHAIYVNHYSKYTFIYNNEIGNAAYSFGDNTVQILGGRTMAQTGGHQFIANTVYSTGAHAFDANNSGNANEVNPILPMEVAYNHFYDTTLTSRDSGAVYMHYGHYGHDREFTQVHHNLVHDSLISHPGGTSINAIYFDNSTSGIDCHNNLIYWKDVDGTLNPVYVQRKSSFPTTYSTVPTYTNKSLAYREEDVDMKDLQDLPSGKPFLVGADHASNGRFIKDGKFLGNYEAYKTDYGSIFAQDAVLSDGAYLTDDGYAVFGNTGKITFRDVDLTGKNQIVAFVAGNEKIRDYVLRLEIIKDGKVVESDPAATMITSENYDGQSELNMMIMNFEGKHDIVLSMDNSEDRANELRLVRIRVEHTDAEPVLPTGAKIIYGGEFTGTVYRTMAYHDVSSHYLLARYADRTHHYSNYIFENTLIFEDVEIERDYTHLITYMQANTGDNQYYMQIRVGSEHAEPIAEIDLNFVPEVLGGREVTGYVWRKHKIELSEPMKAGTYDFYVTFEDKDDDEKPATCDMAYFGFYNDTEQSVK